MTAVRLEIPDVVLIKPSVYGDERGWFSETWNKSVFQDELGHCEFVQDNSSFSRRGTLRGLHYQIKFPQGKLVRVARGSVLDVAVDLRRSSATFGQWVSVELSSENHHQLYVPEGFAHGFIVRSEHAIFSYKCTDYYHPEYERCIAWDDPDLAINWQLDEVGQPTLSEKDARGTRFGRAECYR
ncbi:MAG: dTDP-4-dehydrorhamnose 3,5-epimerase [Pseudomonadota bacterium]